jgi:hypothetical protein
MYKARVRPCSAIVTVRRLEWLYSYQSRLHDRDQREREACFMVLKKPVPYVKTE